MPKFQVEVNGSNFLIDVEGKVAKYGFITFRFVEASNANAAERAAVELLRSTEKLRLSVKNSPDDPPVMDVTEIAEVATFDIEDDQQPGFIWYDENPKRWWQFWK
jgi:hypothetical protein